MKSKTGNLYIKIENPTRVTAGQVCFLQKPIDKINTELERGYLDEDKASDLLERYKTGDLSFIRFNISMPADPNKPYKSFGKKLGQINEGRNNKYYIVFNRDEVLEKDSVIFLNPPEKEVEFRLKSGYINPMEAKELNISYKE